MSKEADELASALEKLLSAERMGTVTGWVLGSTFGQTAKYGLRVRMRSGAEHVAYGATPDAAIDALIASLAKALEEGK